MAWYYALQGIRKGPVTDVDFDKLVRSGNLPPETLVWRSGMKDWLALSVVIPEINGTPGVAPMVRPEDRGNESSRISSGRNLPARSKTTRTVPAMPARVTARITTLLVPGNAEIPSQMEFSGTGTEYFKLWIWNALLSILTLGLYSPWARVKSLQYFAHHTYLDSQPFDFKGSPMAILRGRLLIVLPLLAAGLAWHFFPYISLGILSVLVLLLPWVLHKSVEYRIANTHFYGQAFSYEGSVSESYFVHLFIGLVTIVTAGLALPLFWLKRKKYVIGGMYYGLARFDYTGHFLWFVGLYFKLVALNTLAIAVVGMMLVPSALLAGFKLGTMQMNVGLGAIVLLVSLLFLPPFYNSRIFNHTVDNTTIGPRVRLVSNIMRARELLWIYSSNIIMIIVTLGLAIPWAKVRTYRYRVSKLCVLSQGGLTEIAITAMPAAGFRDPLRKDGMDVSL